MTFKKYGITKKSLVYAVLGQTTFLGDSNIDLSWFMKFLYAIKAIICVYFCERKSSDGRSDVVDVARFGRIEHRPNTTPSWYELIVFRGLLSNFYYDVVENMAGDF